MKTLITAENIRLGVSAADWQEAVLAAGRILEEQGYVTPEYVDAMVETVKVLGPYIVVAPGLAMPHAKSTRGVLKSGISIVTLRSPIEFGNADNDPVHILVGLAGANDDFHLDILQAIASIFEDEGMVEELAACTSPQGLAKIFNEKGSV